MGVQRRDRDTADLGITGTLGIGFSECMDNPADAMAEQRLRLLLLLVVWCSLLLQPTPLLLVGNGSLNWRPHLRLLPVVVNTLSCVIFWHVLQV